jgi:hypothetical protein
MEPSYYERKGELLAEVAFSTPSVAVDALQHSARAFARAGELRRRRALRGAIL